MVNLICFTKLEWNWDTNRAVTLGRLLGNLPLPPRLHIFKPSKRSIIYPLLMYLFCFESSFNASQSVNILIYPYESLFSFAAILFSFFPKIFSLPQVFFFRRRSFSFARSFFLLPWPFLLLWTFPFCRNHIFFCRDFSFAARFLLLLWPFSFLAQAFLFCHEYFSFAARFLLLSQAFLFCCGTCEPQRVQRVWKSRLWGAMYIANSQPCITKLIALWKPLIRLFQTWKLRLVQFSRTA